jgi:hypothetical protein
MAYLYETKDSFTLFFERPQFLGWKSGKNPYVQLITTSRHWIFEVAKVEPRIGAVLDSLFHG